MTLQQRKNKIEELKFWLKSNPNHPNSTTVQADLRKLEQQQAESETYEQRTN